MDRFYRTFCIRNWQPADRQTAADLIASVLTEYGLGCEPCGADQDVLNVEQAYWKTGGEFWVVEQADRLVGTAAFYPIARGNQAVEIRKMYLLPAVRGQGLGRFLLQALEATIVTQGYEEIWIETATVLKEAVQLYENSGYQATTGVETARCDRVYVKRIRQH
ncbi:GNAT family N-acetyltransferase [Leptolyngbya sp. FACHB-711]|uniref:GNAT family N-acetyltransferase n=1 Tax=unclassified Leptolyngbya TaxID=2650499 RepID=UPI00168485EC|nr:GNAT family N-acetyltransferase [Leptolyngbya sp. FACHB-711]MBD1850704.1 GNAT family N-acetyltransferase [Cyanobacteria bacterium FACHB-502]MBD2025512.1 GNAT family N-acetyltransferase [Leptolyngbya sp. FACHB-711]